MPPAEDNEVNKMTKVTVTVNGRDYNWPNVPAIAICLDGCEPAYLDEAIAAGLMPTLKRIKETGTVRTAHSVIPSFTNPNNLSIATGRPPAVHGICGNYLYDRETGTEVMMNDVRFLRAPTIFKGFYDAGAKVAVVTAKDKLRALLGQACNLVIIARFVFRQSVPIRQRKRKTALIMHHNGWVCRCRRFIPQSFQNLCSLPV